MRAPCSPGSADGLPYQRKVLHEQPERGLLLLFVAQPQQSGWMNGGEHVRGMRALDEAAALRGDLEILADHGLRRRRAEADDDARPERADLTLEPLAAGVDLALRGGLVQPPLAPRLPFEVLDRVGDLQVLARHLG